MSLRTLVLGLTAATLLSLVTHADEATTPTSAKRITVYYLHHTFRCLSCNSIESLTRAALLGGDGENTKQGTGVSVESPYAKVVKRGQLAFESVNIDLPSNAVFTEELKGKAKLPLVVLRDGDTVVETLLLDQVWDLLSDNEEFVTYIQKSLAPLVKEL